VRKNAEMSNVSESITNYSFYSCEEKYFNVAVNNSDKDKSGVPSSTG
jgi:hypothetical protein